MPRLIDADKLKADFIGNRYGTQAIEYVIDQQPTVDAEPVVRCKNCKYLQEDECPWTGVINLNGYCSRGEKRNESGQNA